MNKELFENTWSEHHDAAVSLWRKNVHQSIAVLVQRNRGIGLQQLSVNCAQNTNIVIGAWRNEKIYIYIYMYLTTDKAKCSFK